MKQWIIRATGILLLNSLLPAAKAQSEIYEIRVLSLKTASQVEASDLYLKDVWLPAMHRLGIKNIGVFKPISNDTASVKQIVLLVPYISLDVWRKTKTNIDGDQNYQENSKSFTDADTAHLPFMRVSSTLLQAFPDQPKIIPTTLKSAPDAIYELRSYESPTEELHRIKVDMLMKEEKLLYSKGSTFRLFFMAMCSAETGCPTWNIWWYSKILPRAMNIGKPLWQVRNGKRFPWTRNTETIFQ